MNNCLTGFLTKHKLIVQNQLGFRSGTSTEDEVIALTNSLDGKLGSNHNCYGLFFKAFDTVSVPRLVTKIESLGVRGITLELFKDYLCHRSQCVRIDSFESEYEELVFGIPQDSILGPTLFLMYINDLCKLSVTNCEDMAVY